MKTSRIVSIISIIFLLAFHAHATLRVWSGNATMDNSWTNHLNWSGNIAPVPGDDLQFPFDAAKPNSSDNFTNGMTFGSIQFWHGGTATQTEATTWAETRSLSTGASVRSTTIQAAGPIRSTTPSSSTRIRRSAPAHSRASRSSGRSI